VTRQEIFHAINMERMRQNGLHPNWENAQGMDVLTEEVGEVAHAINEMRHWLHRDLDMYAKCYENMKDELIQVAAVCVRWLENVD
jgi:NTP pyrophosphatase (non-canonical NTP hydrolase)